NLPDGKEEAASVIAAEVKSLSFSYFDGSDWVDSWDSTTMGADGVTPIGPPRLIKITIGMAKPGTTGDQDQDVKVYTHVLIIQSANGTTQQQSTGAGATP